MLVSLPALRSVLRAAQQRRRFLNSVRGWTTLPPHITVLYPFKSRAELRDSDWEVLARVVRQVPQFDTTLTHIERFANAQVSFLAPLPADPFRQLTNELAAAYPQYQPYCGRYPEVVPHLTVWEGPDRTDLPGRLGGLLPVVCPVTEVALMEMGRFPRRLARFSLGDPE